MLYSTQGCHLCEMALELIQQARIDVNLSVIDIALDDALFSRYGVTIPVLSLSNSTAELCWPFDLQQLQHWLESNGITYYP
ncbi:glutaredoxin family protein [Vibrio sp. SM6]|uniref:Glutaredoxin family protein n=2 Tax=Vibrio agarilyticus TaxID=2726741 RepID=A0A7X8TQ39_9VIBR|nr:glutaredoxin family protein [Vibrio agarilyticus]NLS12557.1 glutaredoxin family protein [Vibrio agarilyticus]